MENINKIKVEWQLHNRDNGMSWNEIAELINSVVDTTLVDFEDYLTEADYDVWWMEGAVRNFKNQ